MGGNVPFERQTVAKHLNKHQSQNCSYFHLKAGHGVRSYRNGAVMRQMGVRWSDFTSPSKRNDPTS